MAAALASRMNALGFLRQSFALVRTLSASPGPPASAATDAAAADPAKPKQRKKKNLFEVAQFLPNWGIGYKMAKSHWRDVSYQITKINLYKDGRHGKAWGIRHKSCIIAFAISYGRGRGRGRGGRDIRSDIAGITTFSIS